MQHFKVEANLLIRFPFWSLIGAPPPPLPQGLNEFISACNFKSHLSFSSFSLLLWLSLSLIWTNEKGCLKMLTRLLTSPVSYCEAAVLPAVSVLPDSSLHCLSWADFCLHEALQWGMGVSLNQKKGQIKKRNKHSLVRGPSSEGGNSNNLF